MCPSPIASNSSDTVSPFFSYKILQIKPLNFPLKVHQIHAFRFKNFKKSPGGAYPRTPLGKSGSWLATIFTKGV